MATWLDALLEAVPPPDQPGNPGATQVGPESSPPSASPYLPTTRGSSTTTGSGTWGGYLGVLNPFSVNRYLNPRLIIDGLCLWWAEEPEPPSSGPVFLDAWNRARRGARTRRRASPYPFFPDVPALILAHSPQEVHWLYWLAGTPLIDGLS